MKTEELAQRIGLRPEVLHELLLQDLRRGLVERDPDGGWRLSPAARSEYGDALAAMAPLTRDERSERR